MKLGLDHKLGAGIYDIVWEEPNVFYSAGYDTYVRLWDLRSGNCVKEWDDPTDHSVYCIASDFTYTVVSGTSMYGVVRLWDKRQVKCVDSYFTVENHCTPVYSVAWDNCYLYAALDTSLVMHDYTKYNKF